MKTLILIVASLISITGFAQTKLISFRSHSGSNAHFRTAIENDLFDISNSNFGLAVRSLVDTVIRVSNNQIVVVTRDYYRSRKNQVYVRDTLLRAYHSNLFEANNMQNLKAAIRKMYNPPSLDRTFFIGFKKQFGNRSGKK